MMQPIDLGDPVISESFNEDFQFEEDMEEVPKLTVRDRIAAACVEGGSRFGVYASRKLRRVKNVLLDNGPPIDDSWDILEDEEDIRASGKSKKKTKSTEYHSFVSSAPSGNERPRTAKLVHHVEQRVACKETAVPPQQSIRQPTEPAKKMVAPIQSGMEPAKKPADIEIVSPANQMPSAPAKAPAKSRTADVKQRTEQQTEQQAKQQMAQSTPKAVESHKAKVVETPPVKPVPKSVDSPVVEPVVEPVDGPVVKSAVKAVEKPADKPAAKPIIAIDEVTTKPAERTAEEPVDKVVEKPVDKVVQKPIDKVSEQQPTAKAAEKPTETVVVPAKQKGKQKKKKGKYQGEDWLEEVEALQKASGPSRFLAALPR
ncbi:hypothetical protein B0T21DRAFT_175945 [Apiosordaria backusii]|uniref:Uncharacterized protein n=1 Tax=Apiosordaria backusii TaxID=314023 RepID=A0AA40BL62_9PEZI|nr:hypothetical protein B0T21DRAFT_175945 [Apiosordaria backusii]